MSQMYKTRQKRYEPAEKSSAPSASQAQLFQRAPAANHAWAEELDEMQSTLGTVTSLDPHAGKQLHLDEALSSRMQEKFGIRMDQVELRESDQAAQMDAKAFAKGNVIQFAPGQFQPDTQQGQQLIQHELSHVAQQAQGGIHADVPGLNINANEGLEHQADLGVSAGSGGAPMSVGSLDAASAPVQGDFGAKIKNFFRKAKRAHGFGKKTREKDQTVQRLTAEHEAQQDEMVKTMMAAGYSDEEIEAQKLFQRINMNGQRGAQYQEAQAALMDYGMDHGMDDPQEMNNGFARMGRGALLDSTLRKREAEQQNFLQNVLTGSEEETQAEQMAASLATRPLEQVLGPHSARTNHVSKTPWVLGAAGTGIKEFAGGKMGLLKPSKEEKAANLQKALGGDYSRLARADKDDVQAQLVDPRKAQISADLAALDDNQMQARYAGSTTQMLDPVNRKAMSQMARDQSLSEQDRQRLHDLTEGMDTQMMVNTMSTTTDQQRQALIRHYQTIEDQRRLVREYELSDSGKTYLGGEGGGTPEGARAAKQAAFDAVATNQWRSRADAEALADADIQRSQNAGDAMLRMMFLMQIGDFQRTDQDADGNKTNREWDQTMANAFSHGGRTGFVFDKTTTDASGKAVSTDDVADAIFGANMGHDAGVHTRAAGTHYIKTGRGRSDYTEKGGIGAAIKSKMSSRYQHYGMDMAIGGIGREGVAGEGGRGALINADGRSGHMYIGKKTSTAEKAGGLLVGLESDSPYRMNQTGHMHNAAAEAEEGSSTGGLKTDLQGKKYGGRTVDLGGLKNEEVVRLLNGFTQHFSSLRSGDAAQQAQYQALLGQIAGKRMDAQSLHSLMGNFVQDEEELERLMAIFRH